jgi:GNAT superfamily N-acetyltransferase
MEKKGSPQTAVPHRLEILPVTPKRWHDLETLFGPRGACGGCWCMFWRLNRSDFEKQKGLKNKEALRKIVVSGRTPGLLAYACGKPIGWCALGPRESFPVLERSRILAPIDQQSVWAVVCFYVAKPFRRKGVTRELLRAAAEYAARRGAKVLEGYPVAPKKSTMPDVFAWTGFASAFEKTGFHEVARRSPTRPIMRCWIPGS